MFEKYTEKTEAFLLPWLTRNGYSLIKTEFVEEDHYYYLRIYIDLTEEEQRKREERQRKEKETENADSSGNGETAADEETDPGVGINDCAAVSRYVSKWLDREDFIKESYSLEVCSRGFLPEDTN